MKKDKNLTLFIMLALVLIALVVGVFFLYYKEESVSEEQVISSFEECVAAGYPVQESYPAQCTTEDGQTFSEEVEESDSINSEIQVESPTPNQLIEGTVTVTGKAVGSWLFEGNTSVKLYNAENEIVAEGLVTAQSDWMTEKLVPFTGTLTFDPPETQKGKIVIEKSNPSGLDENSDEFVVPIFFK